MNLQAIDPLTRVLTPRHLAAANRNWTTRTFRPRIAHLYTIPVRPDSTIGDITIIDGAIVYNPDTLTSTPDQIAALWDSLIPDTSDLTAPEPTLTDIETMLDGSTFTVPDNPVHAYAQAITVCNTARTGTDETAAAIFSTVVPAYAAAGLPDLAILTGRPCAMRFGSMDPDARPSVEPLMDIMWPVLFSGGLLLPAPV